MSRTFRVLALFGSGTVLLTFGVLVMNQTAQAVQLTTAMHPTLGTVTLWSLIATYTVMIGAPTFMLLRMPSPLIPPKDDEGPEFDAHLKNLAARLSESPHLKGHDLSRREGIEAALRILDEKANRIVRETASGVFIATAVSQSGKLDGLLVLAAQSRLVWKVAHLYYQRPAARDLMHLYANVVGTSFLAGELQELDLSEQVEPVLSSVLGALGASVPGLQVAGALFANCVLSGSANAFLTLRIGVIAKRHCGALVLEQRAALRKNATTEASQYIGAVVAEGSARLSKALWRASVGKVGEAVSGVKGYAKETGGRLITKLKSTRVREQPEAI